MKKRGLDSFLKVLKHFKKSLPKGDLKRRGTIVIKYDVRRKNTFSEDTTFAITQANAKSKILGNPLSCAALGDN